MQWDLDSLIIACIINLWQIAILVCLIYIDNEYIGQLESSMTFPRHIMWSLHVGLSYSFRESWLETIDPEIIPMDPPASQKTLLA